MTTRRSAIGERPSLERRRTAVELFAGTAGATAVFRTHGWNVVTVDVDGRHKPDIVADVRALPLLLGPDVGRPVEVLWGSPPCTGFSDANPNAPLRPSLELMFAMLTAVQQLRPRFWVLENVRGAIPFLGIPAQKIGPWCLWGYFPELRVSLSMHDHRKVFELDGRSPGGRAGGSRAGAVRRRSSSDGRSGLRLARYAAVPPAPAHRRGTAVVRGARFVRRRAMKRPDLDPAQAKPRTSARAEHTGAAGAGERNGGHRP